MASRTDTAAHTKAFGNLVAEHWGGGLKPKCSVPRMGLEPTTHRLTSPPGSPRGHKDIKPRMGVCSQMTDILLLDQ